MTIGSLLTTKKDPTGTVNKEDGYDGYTQLTNGINFTPLCLLQHMGGMNLNPFGNNAIRDVPLFRSVAAQRKVYFDPLTYKES